VSLQQQIIPLYQTGPILDALRNKTSPGAISQETLTLTSRILSALTPHLRIDSRIYYNPRELDQTAEWSHAQADALNALDRTVRLVSSLAELLHKLLQHTPQNQHEALLGAYFKSRCELIYRLSCWCSIGYSNDEWDLEPELRSQISS
jgi:hypothetical protein